MGSDGGNRALTDRERSIANGSPSSADPSVGTTWLTIQEIPYRSAEPPASAMRASMSLARARRVRGGVVPSPRPRRSQVNTVKRCARSGASFKFGPASEHRRWSAACLIARGGPGAGGLMLIDPLRPYPAGGEAAGRLDRCVQLIVCDGWPAALAGADEVISIRPWSSWRSWTRVTRWCGLLMRSCCTPSRWRPASSRGRSTSPQERVIDTGRGVLAVADESDAELAERFGVPIEQVPARRIELSPQGTGVGPAPD